VTAFDTGACGANYLLGGSDASYQELIRLIGRATDRKVPRRTTPAWVLRALGRALDWTSALTGTEPQLTPEKVALVTNNWHCASARAVRELDYSPVALIDMVADCVGWMREADLLG
jgi:nucleoside-diphosphate-sugar epimerase